MNQFKEIPGLKNIYINKNGEVYNFNTKKYLRSRKSKNGYIKINITLNKIEKTYRLHRLLAITFIPNPLNKPYINHIDGNKSNNDLSNLEWCTPKENSEHSSRNGLNSKGVVLSKNIKTGEIINHVSAYQCSYYFNIRGNTLIKHLKSKEAGTRTFKWCVFKYDDGLDWPIIKECKENTLLNKGYWLAKKEITDEIFYNHTFYSLCDALNISRTNTENKYKKNKNDYINGYLFKYVENITEEISNILPNNNPTNNGGIKIKVEDIENKNTLIFKSKIELSKVLNIPIGTINYNLNKDSFIFKNYLIRKL